MSITPKVIKEFQEWLKLMEFSPYTINTYVKIANILLLGKKVRQINCYEFFQKFKEEMIKNNKPTCTIKIYGMAAKKFLLFLLERYHCRIIELSHIKYRNQKQRPVSYLTLQEIEKIRNAKMKGPEWLEVRTKAIFEFLLFTGCRAVETLGVKLKDINDKELFILGKGNKERKVFISGAEKAMNQWLQTRPRNSDYLFSNQFGGRMHYPQIYKYLVLLGKEAAIQKILSPHLMRRTCCTYMIWSGADPKVVQIYMGHDSMDTVFKYYVGVNEERMRNAHAMLQGVLTKSLERI